MSERTVGTVKWFNVDKGFGFIRRDGGEDVFVHFRSFRDKSLRHLEEGQSVRFSIAQGPKGFQAEDLEVVDGADD